MTDRVTKRYLDRCLAGDHALTNAMAEARSGLPERFDRRWGEWMLPRPIFVDEAQILAFADDLAELFRLLCSLPHRMFGGDLGRYCRRIGLDEKRAALLSRFTDTPQLYGRADALHDGTGFKVMEYNVGSEIGGIDTGQMSEAWLKVDSFRSFADANRLGYVDTGRRLAENLRAAAVGLTGGATPVVALVEPDNGMNDYLLATLSFQTMLQSFGLNVVIGEVSEIVEQGGRLHLQGRPIDVVLRYFTEDEIVADPNGEKAIEPIVRAHEEQRVVLWTTLSSKLFASKGCLALLFHPAHQDALTPADTALIDRLLPWTRMLASGLTEIDGTDVDLLDYCREAREQLLIKPCLGHSGAGIVAGWRTNDRDWKEALSAGAAHGAVAQRRVAPRPEMILDPHTGEVEEWRTTWSSFVMPDGYAGTSARTLPLDNDNELLRVTPVFHYSSPD